LSSAEGGIIQIRAVPVIMTRSAMFCQTRHLSNPFAIDHTIISLFDGESQMFVNMATMASIGHISMTPLNCSPSKTHYLVQDAQLSLLCKPSYS